MSKVFNWALARWVSYGSFNGNSFGVLDCIGYTFSFPVLVWGNQSEPDYKTGECAILSIASWLFQRIFSAISTFIPVMSSKVRFTFSALPTTSTCRGGQPPDFYLKTAVVVFVFRLRLIIIHPWWHRNQSYNVTSKWTQSHVVRKCIWVLAPFHELIKLNLSQHKKND